MKVDSIMREVNNDAPIRPNDVAPLSSEEDPVEDGD